MIDAVLGGSVAKTTAPEEVKRRLQVLHASEAPINDAAVDGLLGLHINDTERQIRHSLSRHMPEQYQGEQLWLGISYVWTKYEDIRSDVKALNLGPEDVIYDLGSGYGRFPLYVGLTTAATAKGIEILPQRVAVANAAKEHLGLSAVHFTTGNVLDQDVSDGNVFYMFNPFNDHTFTEVKERLKAMAANKSITVAVSNAHLFDNEDWLVKSAAPNEHTCIYTTRHG